MMFRFSSKPRSFKSSLLTSLLLIRPTRKLKPSSRNFQLTKSNPLSKPNYRLDKQKLKLFLAGEYGPLLSKAISRRIKKAYNDFKGGQYLDFDRYCELTEKLINRPVEYLNKLFFQIIDYNQDGKLCEMDLFKAIECMMSESQMSNDLVQLLNEDLQLIHQSLLQKGENAKDKVATTSKMDGITQTLELVKKSGMTFEREDPVERAKMFFLLVQQKHLKSLENHTQLKSDQQYTRQETTTAIDDYAKYQEQMLEEQPRLKLLIKQKETGTLKKNQEDFRIHLKYAQRKKLKGELFQSYLMDLIDKKRACITMEDYEKLMGEFQCQGCPRLIVDLLSKLSGQNFERLLMKKQNLLSSIQKKYLQRRGGIIGPNKEKNIDEIMHEEKQIKMIKHRMEPIMFLKYEWLFRILSSDRDFQQDQYDLHFETPLCSVRVTLNTIKQGLKVIYGGKPNINLTLLIYNYFSKGLRNYEIKFSQFMLQFIHFIEIDHDSINELVFKMLDEDRVGYLTITSLIRLYLKLPKQCLFAQEVRQIFSYYMKHNLMPSALFKKSPKYDIWDFKSIVKDSCLARELYDIFHSFSLREKLVMLPMPVKFGSEFDMIQRLQSSNTNSSELSLVQYIIKYKAKSDSVMFNRDIKDEQEIYDEEIQKSVELFGEKLTESNIDKICQKLLDQA
ncbi:hypothetical protein FGO68_gene7004 [Halteria grandinella]|uniref:BRCT domain-containing protein n=1 Tax=Halteria grandinella TaxID=5974 RepID=A0A8J8P1P3_HALGN|nr:hypothetical protein FGO68_gene7004 [Halteria grandinella]